MNDAIPWVFHKIHPDAQLPTKAAGSVGWDIRTIDNVTIKPFERKLLSTGFSSSLLEFDKHYILKPRSGLAYKHGIHVMAGVIDNSYNGKDDELKVLLINLSNEPFVINKGDKVCQAVIIKEIEVEPSWGDLSNNSNRSGFGSTGK